MYNSFYIVLINSNKCKHTYDYKFLWVEKTPIFLFFKYNVYRI